MSRPPSPPSLLSSTPGLNLNPLQRAHSLSAQASTLLQPLHPASSALQDALSAYKEAADLFEAQLQVQGDEGTKATLRMLVVQHKKYARDLERRIAMASKNSDSPGNGSGSRSGAMPRQLGAISSRRVVTEGASAMLSSAATTSQRRTSDGPNAGVGLALGAMGPSPWQQNPGIASRLSPPRGIPPFSLRPPPPLTTQSQPVISTLSSSALTSPREPPFDPLSPLHSSSSSSEATTTTGQGAPEESYIHFGAVPETLDPFSRFWGMLDNMLEDISNPVVFASAPLDVEVPTTIGAGGKVRMKKDKSKGKKKEKEKDRDRERVSSPSESFYVVRKGKEALGSGESDDEYNDPPSKSGPSAKTPEELALENASLRTSLDSLASYAQTLDQNNRQLKERLEERERQVMSTINGVRREAGRVKRDQDVWRSQILQGSMLGSTLGPGLGSVSGKGGPGSAPVGTAATGGKEGDGTALKKRIKELEDQVRDLKTENEKHKNHIERYRSRFDKIKSNARAKKQAKMIAEGGGSHIQSNGPTSADADADA
ncbi:hypothetical protein IAR55_006023 [Kwoniella newhampshirensis]|uniref:MIT domain-containing protein n=1 Tax=Kwoniella newhampshirensis TaxID=1651941 RepID=A0AAW0YF19_9TREE